MGSIRLVSAVLAGLLLTGLLLAGDGPSPLAAVAGVVEKVEKDALTVRPRGADGKFQKTLTLKLTGTSKLTVVTQQKRAGKLVAVQKEIEAKDLQAKQPIAVIYTSGKVGNVILSAVAQPAKAP